MKIQVDQEKTNSKRSNLQLSAKIERVKALEKKFGVKDLQDNNNLNKPQEGRVITNNIDEMKNKMSNTISGGVLISDKS